MRIDFYVLKETKPEARYPFICRLLDKAYRQKQKVYVHADNEKEAHIIDDLLWTFKDDCFIPHNLAEETLDPPPPIQIGYEEKMPASKNILINMSADVPNFHHRFQRIIELVPQDDFWKTKTREHYRFYREQGWQVQTHQM